MREKLTLVILSKIYYRILIKGEINSVRFIVSEKYWFLTPNTVTSEEHGFQNHNVNMESNAY